MEKYNLSAMKKGWFVGDFEPTVIRTRDCEVGVKYYQAGTIESSHYHKLADELTVIIRGKVRMNKNIYKAGDIVKVFRDEVIEFEAIEDSTTVVYKSASVSGDKYIISEEG